MRLFHSFELWREIASLYALADPARAEACRPALATRWNRKAIAGILALFFFPALAAAQFTTVSGTVTDPSGLAYANGTITPVLTSSTTPTFTATGLAYTPPTSAVALNGSGSFTMQLADNTQLSPGGTKWNFVVNCGQGCVLPAGGKGAVSFTLAAPITISGSSQNISAQLQAAALSLSNITNSTFPTAATATEATNTVTLTTVSGVFPAAYINGATISVVGCSVAGYNIAAAITGGGAGTSTLTYTDPTGSLGPATSCTANVIIGSTTPGFATVLSGTNPNALLVSGTLAPTGGGTISANLLAGLTNIPFIATNGSNTPVQAPCTAAQVLVGNSSNFAVCQPLTGDSSITNAGVMTNTKVNGTSFASLATGPLCNTTATGVPFICAAGNFPTLNQNTTGNAATATSASQINGTAFPTSATVIGSNGSAQPVSQTQAATQTFLNGSTVVPGFFGNTATPFPAWCMVGTGTGHASALSCASLFSAAGGGKAGLIFDISGGADYPNTASNGSPFTDTAHSTQPGTTWFLNGGAGGLTPSTGSPTIPIIEEPLVMASSADLIGLLGQASFNQDTSSGNAIMSGTNFPAPLTNRGTNWHNFTPTLAAAATGTIGAVTVYVCLVEEGNAYGLNQGSAHGGAVPTDCSGEASITFGSGSTNSITVTAPAALGSGDTNGFGASEYSVCASTVSGQEVCGCRQNPGVGWCKNASITCGVAGVMDPVGDCTIAGGNATITSVPSLPNQILGITSSQVQQSGAFKPPVVDLTYPMIIVGNWNGTTGAAGANSAGERIKDLSLWAGPTFGTNTTVTNQVSGGTWTGTPSVGIWQNTCQESCTIENIQFAGGFSGAMLYWTRGQGRALGIFPNSNNLYSGAGGPAGPSGTLNSTAGAVTGLTGAPFQANWVGGPLWINVSGTFTPFQITAWTSPTSITIANPPANQAGSAWFFGCTSSTFTAGTTCFWNAVFDSWYYSAISSVNVSDSSFNEGSQNAIRANVLVRGGTPNNASVGSNAIFIRPHMENAVGAWASESPAAFQGAADNILCDDGANCGAIGGMGWGVGTGATIHRTATAGAINTVGTVDQSGNKIVIQDDARSITIRPAILGVVDTDIPVTYDSQTYVAKNFLTSDMTGNSTTTQTTIGITGASNTVFTFGVEANKTGTLICDVAYNASAATAGISIQVTGTQSVTAALNALSPGNTSTALTAPTLYSTGLSTPVSAGTTVFVGTQTAHFESAVQNGSANNLLTVQDAPQGIGTLINKAGSRCQFMPQQQIP